MFIATESEKWVTVIAQITLFTTDSILASYTMRVKHGKKERRNSGSWKVWVKKGLQENWFQPIYDYRESLHSFSPFLG